MTTEKMLARDVYVRHTNTDGHSYAAEHRVWDVGLFMSARESETTLLNAKVESNGKRLAKVEQITREQYLQERTK